MDLEPMCSLSASTSISTKLPKAVMYHVLFDESCTVVQLERINVYCNEAAGGRYASRAILIDLEPICSLSASTSTLTKMPEAVMHHLLF